jgi:hypothetical protein
MVGSVVRQHLAAGSTSYGRPCTACTAFAARVVPNPGRILGRIGGLWRRGGRYLGADLRAGLVVVCLVVDVGRSTGRASARRIPAASGTVVGADVVGDTAGGSSCSRSWIWRSGRSGRRCLDAGLTERALCFFAYPFVVVAGEGYKRKAKRRQEDELLHGAGIIQVDQCSKVRKKSGSTCFSSALQGFGGFFVHFQNKYRPSWRFGNENSFLWITK